MTTDIDPLRNLPPTPVPDWARDNDAHVDMGHADNRRVWPVFVLLIGVQIGVWWMPWPDWLKWLVAFMAALAVLPLWSHISYLVSDPAFLDRLRALPGEIMRAVRRARIIVRVRMLPDDVTDAATLRDRIFPDLPLSEEHRQTREAFIQGIISRPRPELAPDSDDARRRQEWLLTMAQCIQPLERWGDDPLAALRGARALSKPAPSPAPVATAQSFLAAPIAAAGFFSQRVWAGVAMVAAAASVVLLLLNWAGGEEKRALRAELDQARADSAVYKANADNAGRMATSYRETLDELAERQQQEARRTAALIEQDRARRDRAMKREGLRREAFSRPDLPDFDSRLRELAQPSAADAVPGVPDAAPADPGAAGVPATGIVPPAVAD